MLNNYIKIAIRNLLKYKAHSAINMLGLILGFTTFILISLYVMDELSYDKHYADADRIYRLEVEIEYQGNVSHWAATQGNWIPRIQDRYPEIESATRLLFSYFPKVFNHENVHFTEDHVFYVDSTFFDIFSYALVQGDPAACLNKPGQAVITQTVARKYFGSEDVIGLVMEEGENQFTISGVCEDNVWNSHFHFDILLSLETLRTRWPQMDEPGPNAFHSYFKLGKSAALSDLAEKLDADKFELMLQTGEEGELPPGLRVDMVYVPVTHIHLFSNQEKELEPNGSISKVYIFSTIAILVLIIACINYINLTTARSLRRAREVGIRKVVGAQRRHLFLQFIAESAVFAFCAMVSALLIVWFLLPYFNDLADKSMVFSSLITPGHLTAITLAYLISGFLSGLYPGLVLSGFSPSEVFKSQTAAGRSDRKSLYLRRGLVIFQFGVSALLLISSVFIFKQMDFINTKELGFSKDQVLILPHPGQQMDVMKSKLQERSDVKSSSATSAVPGERFIVLSVRVPDLAGTGSTEELEDDGSRGLRVLCADEDIVQTLGLEILDGRPFSLEFGTDSSSAFILNEAAVLDLGLEDPVGKAFEYTYNLPEPKAGQIVGIVKDFHYASLHTEVDPLMIQIFPPYYRNLMVKLDTSDIQTSIADIQALWNQVVPNVPFDYSFLDTSYDQMYKSELNLKKIVSFFTLLAILVAALGLSGLTSYSTEQRRKEIAIRKVLGASAINIFKNLSGEFVLLVIAANIIAWIPAWFFMKNWLQEFAFQIDLTAWPFLLILIAVLMLTLLMIVGSSYRNIHANPVKSLHYE